MQVIGLEEIVREHAEVSRGEMVSDESRERALNQSEESKEEEPVRYRSIQ